MRTFVWCVLGYNCLIMIIKLFSLVLLETDKKYNCIDFLIQLTMAFFALKVLFVP